MSVKEGHALFKVCLRDYQCPCVSHSTWKSNSAHAPQILTYQVFVLIVSWWVQSGALCSNVLSYCKQKKHPACLVRAAPCVYWYCFFLLVVTCFDHFVPSSKMCLYCALSFYTCTSQVKTYGYSVCVYVCVCVSVCLSVCHWLVLIKNTCPLLVQATMSIDIHTMNQPAYVVLHVNVSSREVLPYSSSLVFAVSFHVGSGCQTPDAFRLALEKAYQVFQYAVSIYKHTHTYTEWHTCTEKLWKLRIYENLVMIINTCPLWVLVVLPHKHSVYITHSMNQAYSDSGNHITVHIVWSSHVHSSLPPFISLLFL